MWYLLESTHFSVPELHKTGRDLLIYFLTPLTFEREWYTTLRWDGGSTYILKLMTVGLDIYWFIGTSLQFVLCFTVLLLLQRILFEQIKRTYFGESYIPKELSSLLSSTFVCGRLASGSHIAWQTKFVL